MERKAREEEEERKRRAMLEEQEEQEELERESNAAWPTCRRRGQRKKMKRIQAEKEALAKKEGTGCASNAPRR